MPKGRCDGGEKSEAGSKNPEFRIWKATSGDHVWRLAQYVKVESYPPDSTIVRLKLFLGRTLLRLSLNLWLV